MYKLSGCGGICAATDEGFVVDVVSIVALSGVYEIGPILPGKL